MANITLSTTESNITVDATNDIINITATPIEITVAESAGLNQGEVRASLSNVAPILYNSTTGVFSFDSNATFSGKTTDNLPQGNSNIYFSTTGGAVNTTNLPEGTNQYFTNARVSTAVTNSNITLKQFQETYVNLGTLNGNIAVNAASGSIQKVTLNGNITGLNFSNLSIGGSLTLILQQDSFGYRELITTSGWGLWKFSGDYKTLSVAPNAYDALSVIWDGTNYYGSLINFSASAPIPNSDLANSNVVVNGTTIALGSSGNISHFGSLTTTNLPEGTNLYFTANRARGNISVTDAGGDGSLTYSSANGVITYVGPNQAEANARIDARLSATSPIQYSSGVISLSGAANITTTGNISGGYFIGNGSQLTGMLTNAQVVSHIATVPLTVGGNLDINGNINATGNINYQNVTDLYVRDQKITLNSNAVTNANVEIISNRPTATNTMLKWNEQATRWEFTNNGTVYYPIPTSTTDLIEGANLYYTNPRVTNLLSSGNVTSNVQTSGVLKVWSTSNINNSWIETATIKTYGQLRITGAEYNVANNTTMQVFGNIDLADAVSGAAPKYSRFKQGDHEQLWIDNNSNYYTLPITTITNTTYNNRIYEYTGGQSGSWFAVRGNLIVDNNTSTITGVTGDGVQINQNGTIVATGNITTSANVQGAFLLGNGSAITGLSTTQISEGSNLWFSNARVNSFIQNNITTTDIDEGTNLYFTAARARGNISAAENITYNSTTGVIGMANALANVNSVTAESGQNFTVNTANALITRQKYSNVDVFSGNITSDGYGFFNPGGLTRPQNTISYTGSTRIEYLLFNTGNATAGSNAITNAAFLNFNATANVSISNVRVNSFFARNDSDYAPFPVGTRVTSVDVANSIVYMSANALLSANLAYTASPDNPFYSLNTALYDTQTGFTVILISEGDRVGGSYTTLSRRAFYPVGRYGYPASGPAITDFDVVTTGSISDYSLGTVSLAPYFMGRNKISSPKSAFQAPRGLIVGENADLTNRAENDSIPSFGVNVLWDGLGSSTEYNGQIPLTQLLVKNYTNNNQQATLRTSSGPRLFFTAAEGNVNLPISSTYPRRNLELGRISWWSTSSTSPTLSSVNPPAYISAVTGQDCVSTNSGVGMYFGISPNTATFDRSLFMASSMGNTLIASAQDSTGTHRPIIFAPSHYSPSDGGNAALLYNQTIDGTDTITDTLQTSGAHFAQINYANATALTGSRMAVTNGNNTNSTREGNIVLSIDRNLTSANANVRVLSGTNYYGGNNPDRIRFNLAPQGLVDGTAVTIRNFTNTTVAGALNGNVFFVKRNDSGGIIAYELYTDSGLTTGVNLSVANVNAGGGTIEYTRNNAVTAKDWAFTLPQGSNNLILTEDGVNRTTFASGGNVDITGNINLTGRLLGYDRVYGEFYHSANINPVAADTIYTFPLDTTVVNSDVIANNTSRINIVKPGIYKIFSSIQVKNADNSADHIFRFWLRKNGADVANSATLVTPLKLQEQVVSMHWMVESDGDDYWEIAYYVNNTGVSFPNYAAITSPVTAPSAPPIIVNVLPVGA